MKNSPELLAIMGLDVNFPKKAAFAPPLTDLVIQ
jgi:hypothetical protein